MRVVFARSLTPACYLIRLLTRSKWSHVGIVLDDNTVLHATAFSGVCKIGLNDFLARYKYTELGELQGSPDLALSQIGKGYDWAGLLGIGFRGAKAWNDPARWFCSELVAACSPVFRTGISWRITPSHIYQVSKPV